MRIALFGSRGSAVLNVSEQDLDSGPD
jgi:hypothetical protein